MLLIGQAQPVSETPEWEGWSDDSVSKDSIHQRLVCQPSRPLDKMLEEEWCTSNENEASLK
jgi:hypothetical protein